ncbi:hypothetical protein Aduo_009533 [Ancylostoma duodenale]
MKTVPCTMESLAGVKEFQSDTPSSSKTGVKRKICGDSEDNSVDSEECGVMKKTFVADSENDQVVEFSGPKEPVDYFPFFSLPMELRLRILRELDHWTLGPLRQLSRSMYTLVGTILPRKWRHVLVDYRRIYSYFKETYKDWSNHPTCSSFVGMLRLAYRAEIPRIIFLKARLTPYMMKRFVKAVKCSQAKVVELDFISCDITCDVKRFVQFFKFCGTRRLVIGGCSMEGNFRELLQQNAFLKKAWRRSWGADLYIKASLQVKSEEDITDYIRRDHDRDRIHDSYPVHRHDDRYIFRSRASGERMYVKYKDGIMLINREERPS